jgi:ABC-2 type transport system permease protein
MQIIIFGFALTNEVKNSRIAILNQAKDEASVQLVNRIEASQYFEIQKNLASYKEIEKAFRSGKVRLAIVIPTGFADELAHSNSGQIQIIADASDPNIATTLTNYATAIITDFQDDLNKHVKLPYTITTQMRMLYNPQLKGAYNFVPGVMAMVLMLVCTMMTSIAIVREKETGTMEVLLVSPLRPVLVIIAKAIPYLFLSVINIASILLLSVFVLGLPIQGSLVLLVGESILFTITSLSLGLFISTVAESQQTAMLISLMGMFMPTIVFSGFMFPVENMPVVLQIISNAIPAKWFYYIVKEVMIKGLGIQAIWKETLILLAMTILLLVVSIKKYNLRLA